MTQEVSTKNRITEESIFGQLLLFFFPTLFGIFFQQLYNATDAIVAGRFVGKEALTAVGGSTSVLISLLVGFFVNLSSGAMVVTSQYYGARKADKMYRAVYTSIAFSVMGGTIMMTLRILGSYWALKAMKTPEDVMQPFMIYLRIYFIGTIPDLICSMGASILRAVRDSKRPLYFLITSYFVSIVLDVLLVAVLKIGMAGAAIATIVSQLSSAVLVVWTLTKTEDTYKLEWKKVKIDQEMLRRTIRIGIPAGMQSIVYNISNIIIQAGVNTLGTDNVTAQATYGKVDDLFWVMANTLGIAAATFVGQNYGAGRIDRVRKGVGACMMMGAIMTTMAGVAPYYWGHYLVLMFTTDPQVQEISVRLLHSTAPTFITYIAIGILSGTLRGVGDVWMPLVITDAGTCDVRVLWIVFVLPRFHNTIGAAFYYPLTWSLTSVCFTICYYFFSSLARWKIKPFWRKLKRYKPF